MGDLNSTAGDFHELGHVEIQENGTLWTVIIIVGQCMLCTLGTSLRTLWTSLCTIGTSLSTLMTSLCTLGTSLCIVGKSLCTRGKSLCNLGTSL